MTYINLQSNLSQPAIRTLRLRISHTASPRVCVALAKLSIVIASSIPVLSPLLFYAGSADVVSEWASLRLSLVNLFKFNYLNKNHTLSKKKKLAIFHKFI